MLNGECLIVGVAGTWLCAYHTMNFEHGPVFNGFWSQTDLSKRSRRRVVSASGKNGF